MSVSEMMWQTEKEKSKNPKGEFRGRCALLVNEVTVALAWETLPPGSQHAETKSRSAKISSGFCLIQLPY